MSPEWIDEYAAGADLLRRAVAGLPEARLDERPIPGQWSIREVVCHLADFEPIYADRMKRVLAETEPRLVPGDPDVFARRLAYGLRELENELTIVESTRRQMATILRSASASDAERTGLHPHDGPLTLAALLRRITGHIPHHVRFIEMKRRALEGSG